MSNRRRAQKKDKAKDLPGYVVTMVDPRNVTSEAYRNLRTNLLYSYVDNPPKIIVLTSPGPQEGKSTTCANLGVVLAQADKSTLMLDCDFRKPVLHKMFGTRNIFGVVDILAGGHKLQEVWHEPTPGLKVVCVGPIPPNPAELLGSKRLAELLATVRKEFDYILIDAPPIGLVSDPAILATQGDGVLLILDAQNTRKEALRQSVRSLKAVGANVLGTVMNNVKGEDKHYYGYA
jgi:capsular exopolysaccharide synthesis family protein